MILSALWIDSPNPYDAPIDSYVSAPSDRTGGNFGGGHATEQRGRGGGVKNNSRKQQNGGAALLHFSLASTYYHPISLAHTRINHHGQTTTDHSRRRQPQRRLLRRAGALPSRRRLRRAPRLLDRGVVVGAGDGGRRHLYAGPGLLVGHPRVGRVQEAPNAQDGGAGDPVAGRTGQGYQGQSACLSVGVGISRYHAHVCACICMLWYAHSEGLFGIHAHSEGLFGIERNGELGRKGVADA